MHVLVINCGSSSIKYRLIDSVSSKTVAEGKRERLSAKDAQAAYKAALAEILAECKGRQVDAVGHRVVHGGEHFHEAVRIDDQVLARIRELGALAPLHNPRNALAIDAARASFPEVAHVAVFDTAFHLRMPRRARTYAVDPELAADYGIKRFGFHGTSHAYVAGKAAEFLGRPSAELRIVSLHLGAGASACAIEFGHSTETSMGVTPLEGLVMGTRAGDLDPGAILALVRAGKSATEIDDILNNESGLKGLSGAGADLRDIETRAAQGDDRCRLAVNVYAHRARKYIGAYAAVMGGVDAVVLTGGVGENAVAMRRRILQRFDFLGLSFDEDRNADARVSEAEPAVRISADASRVTALVVKTDEELMIARQTAAVAGRANEVASADPVPIAISGRHLHLDAATFAALFGEGAAPTRYRDISQPGQYACAEVVNLVGPRGRIDGVRLIAPLRRANQVEVSRTDEFALGVDAPIRDSGKTEGSAPITLEGPAGSVHLKEGLICAKRHIHMTPKDALEYGVRNGDEVEVALNGGPRDLTFGDVLIRVSPNYKLEMHLDTDEGNAAELSRGAHGELVFADVDGASGVLRTKRTAR